MFRIKLTPHQKKALGMAGIALCALIIATLAGAMALKLFHVSAVLPHLTMVTLAWIIIAVLVFPLPPCYDLWRTGKEESTPPINAHSPFLVSKIKTITIQTRISLAQYRKLKFTLAFSNYGLTAIYIAVLCLTLYDLYLERHDIHLTNHFYSVLLFLIPFYLYYVASVEYRTDQSLNEKVIYRFTAEGFTATGESFTTTTPWATLAKIRERKHWLLLHTIYDDRIVIPKKAFKSFVAMATIRQMRHHLNQ